MRVSLHNSLIRAGVIALSVLSGWCGCSEDSDSADLSEESVENSEDAATEDPSAAGDWTVVEDLYAPGALLSAWAAGEDDVWVVGGEEGASVVLHFDGQSWTEHDPGVSEQLWWVTGWDTGEVMVVGDRGAASVYDGTNWSPVATGASDKRLYGVWGPSADNVWAVGGPSPSVEGSGETEEGGVLLQYDGAAWSEVALPALDVEPDSGRSLFKVWGTSPDFAVIVGSGGTALHWDGADWTAQDTGVNSILFTVTGRSATDLWAVGGFNIPDILHWDGESWTAAEPFGELPSLVQGVWTAPGEDLWISGIDGFVASSPDAVDWTIYQTPTTAAYHAVVGTGGGSFFAVGGDIESQKSDYDGALATTNSSVPSLP